MLGLALLFGCARPPQQVEEEPVAPPAEWQDSRGFDPLELPRDKVVVPEEYPRTDALRGRQGLVEVDDTDLLGDTSQVETPEIEPQVDSANSQAFRVQLMSSRVYSEARYGARVAEEIFDQPVYIDYEVPNYKVRVGNFADRMAAEDYQQRARAAGYGNAWVVVVNLKVKEAAPLYDDVLEGPPEKPGAQPDTAAVTGDGQ
jgi:hypothetical protein